MVAVDILTEENRDSFVVHTLGRFDVIKNGQSLIASSSGSKKIWELYKFMLTHKGRAFTPESLMDQLWVSEEYNDPRSTLRRQMHRLRQTLDEEDKQDSEKTLIFSNGYYKWNDAIQIQLDTELFESFVKHGDGLKEIAPQGALEAYQKALNLYVGDYLPECAEQHWVFAIRNNYRRMFLKTVLTVIELLKPKDAYDEILQLCQKAIHIDIYEEIFHLSLMDALLMKGNQRQALDHYEYITNFYDREMGLKPSDDMKAMFKKLLQSQPTIQSEENLHEALELNTCLENAFYCEPEVFKSIYELERRRSQRSGASFSIGVLTATPIKGYTPSQKELRMNKLKQQLMERLRKGDTFTRWNDRQLVVLLPGVDAELTEKVLKRVLNFEVENAGITIGQITEILK